MTKLNDRTQRLVAATTAQKCPPPPRTAKRKKASKKPPSSNLKEKFEEPNTNKITGRERHVPHGVKLAGVSLENSAASRKPFEVRQA
ncbi:hypothetical protein [Ruegeria profundi]|uniref:hypothetical protein n=1 Tax=Ruegeria profundi TaxID=1685378 RepID=UPI003C7DA410